MKSTIHREKFDAVRASEQFEQYKETGGSKSGGKIINLQPNKLGYSEAYAEGWERIFGSGIKESETQTESDLPVQAENQK